MADKKYYWCSTQKKFGRDIGFGDPLSLDKSRAEDLLSKGLISEKKPESITGAQLNSIDDLKKANAGLAAKVKELEANSNPDEAIKKANGEIKDLQTGLDESNVKVKELEIDLSTANATIKKLEADLEEATKPGKK